MHNPTVLATLTAVLAVLPSAHGFYTKNSPVLQVNAANYERLIAKSNYTSVCIPLAHPPHLRGLT